MKTLFFTTYKFELNAVHKLNLEGENQEPIHGHHYKYYVTIKGDQLDESGFLVPPNKIKCLVEDKVQSSLHKKVLNDVIEFSSGEYLAQDIYKRLLDTELKNYLHKIVIEETTKNRFEYPCLMKN